GGHAVLVTRARRGIRRVEASALRLLQSDRAGLVLVLKTTFASAAAFELARLTVGSRVPALAAMAAIITVQVSGSKPVRRAIEYSAGVAAGVIAAVLLTRVLGVHWWSIALLVLLSLLGGRLIRLGSQANQIAISALLVMSLGSSYGWTRITDTLIGAGIGVATSLVVPRRPLDRALRSEISAAATEISLAVRGMAASVRDGWSGADVRAALGAARGVSRSLAEPRDALEAERDERRVALPSRRTELARALNRCDAALTALDHVTNQVRSVGRTLLALADVGAADPALVEVLELVAQALSMWGSAASAQQPQHQPLQDVLVTAQLSLAQLRGDEPEWVAMRLELERVLGELDPAGAHAQAVVAGSPHG
ncbi:MAG: hypothetical protein JWN31_662, partial [Frankiales bacterium]|nr:hypothetical protein [Frankiales bacterium]